MGTGIRAGVLVPTDAPVEQLVARWRRAEELGFDLVLLTDHSGHFVEPTRYWLDGVACLAVLARETERARIGPLVTTPVLRHPAVLARHAQTIDHLSGGRLELGLGTGVTHFDHDAAGVDYWPPRERAARFAEYVELVDGLLRSSARDFSFEGRFYRTRDTPMEPPPLQRPRPPIVVGGQSPTVRRVAAERADCWNTHGPFRTPFDELVEITARQCAEMDAALAASGRAPGELRRSVLCFGALDAFASAGALERVLDAFVPLGFTEVVVMWPPPERERELGRALEIVRAARPAARAGA